MTDAPLSPRLTRGRHRFFEPRLRLDSSMDCASPSSGEEDRQGARENARGAKDEESWGSDLLVAWGGAGGPILMGPASATRAPSTSRGGCRNSRSGGSTHAPRSQIPGTPGESPGARAVLSFFFA